MSKDRHLQHLLDEINRYIDDLPPQGSSDYLRFTELCSELVSHRIATPEHPLAQELDQLGLKIEAAMKRHEREKHAHDLSPGGESMAPMVGGHIGPD
jgi:hypothetical protein